MVVKFTLLNKVQKEKRKEKKETLAFKVGITM